MGKSKQNVYKKKKKDVSNDDKQANNKVCVRRREGEEVHQSSRLCLKTRRAKKPKTVVYRTDSSGISRPPRRANMKAPIVLLLRGGRVQLVRLDLKRQLVFFAETTTQSRRFRKSFPPPPPGQAHYAGGAGLARDVGH